MAGGGVATSEGEKLGESVPRLTVDWPMVGSTVNSVVVGSGVSTVVEVDGTGAIVD